MRLLRLLLPAGAALALLAAAGPAATPPGPTIAGCPLFPADNVWNRRVDTLPVAAGSDAIVASIGVGDHLHADFGSGLWEGGPIGIPVTVVRGTQRRVRVSLHTLHRVPGSAFEVVDTSSLRP